MRRRARRPRRRRAEPRSLWPKRRCCRVFSRSDGIMPNMSRNALLKCAELAKPAACAASVNDAPSPRARTAAPIRFQIRYRRNGTPVSALNRCRNRDDDRPARSARSVSGRAPCGSSRICRSAADIRASVFAPTPTPSNSPSARRPSRGAMRSSARPVMISITATSSRRSNATRRVACVIRALNALRSRPSGST